MKNLKISLLAGALLIAGLSADAQTAFTASALPASYEAMPVSPVFKTYTVPPAPVRPPGYILANVGRGLTLGGCLLLLSGVIIVSNAEGTTVQYNNGYPSNEKLDAATVFGTAFIINGIGLIIPGVILWTRGTGKMRRYEAEHKVSFNVKGTGGALTYSFGKTSRR